MVLYCKVLFVSLHLCVGVFCVGVGAYVLVGVVYIYVCVRIRVYARVFACAYVCMQFLSLWLPRSLPISDARSLSLSAPLSFSLSLSVREEDQKLNRLMPAVKNFASLVFSFALSHTVHTEEERGNLHAQAHVRKRQCPLCLFLACPCACELPLSFSLSVMRKHRLSLACSLCSRSLRSSQFIAPQASANLHALSLAFFVSVSHSGVHTISCFSLSLLVAATVTIFCILAQTCANQRGLTLTATYCFDHCCILSPPVTYCGGIAPTITHCCNLHKLLWHSVITCKVTQCGGLTQTVTPPFILFHTYP